MRNYLLFLFLLITVVPSKLYSQEKKPFIVFKPDSIDDGRPLLTPFITPGYTPELGFVIAGGGFLSFKMNRADSTLNRSFVPVSFSYSTEGAKVLVVRPTLYFYSNKLFFEGDFWLKSMPDNYFGVGFKETIDKEKGPQTSYYRDWWWIYPKFFWEFRKNLVLGTGIDFNKTIGSDESDEVLQDETYVKYNKRPYNAGVSFIIRYDTRDLPANTYHGFYFNYSSSFYGSFLGGENDYCIHQVDIRNFTQVGKEGQLIAVQAKVRLGTGDIPYGEMSQLGTPNDLRGYLWGRLRDKSLAFGLVEYRHKLYFRGNPTRHSFATWVGIGTVFNENTVTYYGAPNWGIGYRIEVQPRTSMRIDFGMGKNTNGFYFNFQQAF